MSLTKTWENCNRLTLQWMLERHDERGFVDTKVNPLTAKDYTAEDGIRGPDYTYGWIQGRALEALVLHSQSYAKTDPALSMQLLERAKALYSALAKLHAADGHIYFLYDQNGIAQRFESDILCEQSKAGDIYTYSDCFAAKGMVAAAKLFAPEDLPDRLAYFTKVIDAIVQGRFQMDEKALLGPAALAIQKADFGPRMIALGACRLLEELGLAAAAEFGPAFAQHILAHHYDTQTGLLFNTPSGEEVNAGHAIEFVGFALSSSTLRNALDIDLLCDILRRSFTAADGNFGLRLLVSPRNGETLNSRMPWWSLPETIRAAAWAQSLRPSKLHEDLLQQAHERFFSHFWREEQRFAYQTLDASGTPIDFVPATSDLDPAYHTGLSLRAALAAFGPQDISRN